MIASPPSSSNAWHLFIGSSESSTKPSLSSYIAYNAQSKHNQASRAADASSKPAMARKDTLSGAELTLLLIVHAS